MLYNESVVRTDDAIRVQVNQSEVPLEEMPMASLLAGLPMTGLADVAIDLTVPGEGGKYDYRRAAGSIAVACPAGCTLATTPPGSSRRGRWEPAGPRSDTSRSTRWTSAPRSSKAT